MIQRALVLLLLGGCTAASELGQLYDLRVENVPVPAIGLTELKPRLMWRYPVQPDRAQAVSYSVTVTTDAGDAIWASGDVAGAPASVVVGGDGGCLSLQSFTAYRFNVTWRSRDGRTSPAASGSFDMGPVAESDWAGAEFLDASADRHLQTTFTLAASPPSRARLFVDAPGCAVVTLNSHRIGTSSGICPWVQYGHTDLFMSHDVTGQLAAGNNTLDFVLGSGTFVSKWNGTPFLRALLVVLDTSGKTTRVITTGSAPPPPPPPPPVPPGPVTLCGTVPEHGKVHLTCPVASVIANVSTLFFGTPTGRCVGGAGSGENTFAASAKCEAPAAATAAAAAACVGKRSCLVAPACLHDQCTLMQGLKSFTDPCNGVHKRVDVAVTCTPLGRLDGPAAPAAPAAWRASKGGIISDDPWLGCATNWSAVDSWHPAVALDGDPLLGSVRRSSTLPATDVLDLVQPVSAWTAGPFPASFPTMESTCIVKFPRNFVGYLRIDPKSVTVGETGGALHVVHSEVLNLNYTDKGPTIDFDYTWNNHDVHVWSAAAKPSAPIEPTFVWHGFQFVMLGAQGSVDFGCDPANFVGVNTGTHLRSTGSAVFGDDLSASSSPAPGSFLNRLQQMVQRSQQANVAAGIPTDCPTREKHGWLGDGQVTAEEAMYNFDMAAVYSEFINTIADNLNAAGDVPGAVPAIKRPAVSSGSTDSGGGGGEEANMDARKKGVRTDISWTAAFPLIANWLNKYYGDTRVAERFYPALKTYINSTVYVAIMQKRPDGLPDFWTWGDWCAVEDRATATPGTGPELAAFNFILAVDAMREIATALGAAEDAVGYEQMAGRMRQSFQHLYYNSSTRTYGHDPLEVQSLTVAPLALGAVPEPLKAGVLAGLEQNIASFDYHFTVGSAGAKHLLPQLSAHGLGETAMRIATQTTYPSFGHWLALGATTCWENYHGYADPSHPPTPTHNHIFLCGGLGEWMYRSVAGAEPIGPGWSRVRFSPDLAKNGPASGSANLVTVRGPVRVSWRRHSGGAVSMNTTTAAGISAAEVELPLPTGEAELREGGQLLWSSKDGYVPGVIGIRNASTLSRGILTVATGPGAFRFRLSSK